jgi:CubicO group peptidase (beta-lactamase class C family)
MRSGSARGKRLVGAWVSALIGVAGAGSAFAAAPPSPAVTDKTVTEKMNAIFGDYRRDSTPGCAVAMAKDGETVFADAYGMASLELRVPLSADSVFDIGSAAKQFTAASIVLLEQDEKLSLDDPLSRFVPELPEWSRRTTLRQMLHHTSGIRDYTELLPLAGARTADVSTEAEALDMLARQKGLDFPPGSKYSYSNSGYFLLSVVVKRASGRSLRDFAAERIFKPLGMTSTRFVDDHREVVPRRATGYAKARGSGSVASANVYRVAASDWEQNGDGGLQTTVGDLLRWARNFDDPKVGGTALVKAMTTPGRLASGEPIDYALALRVDRDRGLLRVRHGGSWAGFKAEFLRYPERRVTVVTTCNFREAVPSRYARAAARILLPELGEPEPPGASPAPTPTVASSGPFAVSAVSAARFAGAYYSDEIDAIFRVAVRDGGLTLTRRGEDAERLKPLREGVFGSEELGPITFRTDARGSVGGFSIQVGESRFDFVRIPVPLSGSPIAP